MGARDEFRQASPIGGGWRIEELHDGVWTSIAYATSEERMQTLVYGGDPTEGERQELQQKAHGGSRRAVPSEGTRRVERMGPERWRVAKWDGVDWTTIAMNVGEGRAREIADGQEPTLGEVLGQPAELAQAIAAGAPVTMPPVEQMAAVAAAAQTAEDDQEQARLERLAVKIAAVTARFAKELTARGVDEPLVAELTLDCAGRFWERDGDQLLLV